MNENTLLEMNNKLAQYEKNLKEAEEDYAKYVELLDLYNLRLMTKGAHPASIQDRV